MEHVEKKERKDHAGLNVFEKGRRPLWISYTDLLYAPFMGRPP